MTTTAPALLVLGGTAWLGHELARQAAAAGLAVTCLARGIEGVAPQGAQFVTADRNEPDAYAAVSGRDWHMVVDVTWQPGQARDALAALGERTGHWTYVSSISAYRDPTPAGQDEEAPLLEPWPGDVATVEEYGEAKSACEAFVRNALGERALIVRPGLIAGPGDPSDRLGYWCAAMARATKEPVLVPDAPDNPCQVIDVRDLATWLLAAAIAGTTGAMNAVGASMPLGDVVGLCALAAGHRGDVVAASEAFLVANAVQPWAGPRSLPLWLPAADAAFFGGAPAARAAAAGLGRRPLAETIADVLTDERSRGLHRIRRAGLTRDEERELLSIMS